MGDDNRWVVVDETSKTVIGGPYLWDGVTDWTPPEQGTLKREADANSEGYTYPEVPYYPAPDPEPAPDPGSVFGDPEP